MGKYWLHDLPAAVRAAGLDLVLHPGAELRSRSTGGLDAILGVVAHHTAGSSNEASGERYSYDNATDRPIGNMHLRRNGTVVIGAMGAANTQGKGGPLLTSRGTVPINQGNRYMIAVEAHNNGVGEVWPKAQTDAYITLIAAICRLYDLEPSTDVHTHFSYVEPSCPGRKIDPRGPTPGAPSLGGNVPQQIWPATKLRELVAAVNTPPPVVVRHTLRTVPEGMEDDPTRVGDPVWDGSHRDNVRWLQTFFYEQGWWPRTPDGSWTAEFQRAVAFVQRAFQPCRYATSPEPLTRLDGVWWQETAVKIDAWARLQDWYRQAA